MTYNCVLRWDNSFFLAKIFFPFIVAITIGINVVFILIKGSTGQTKFFGTEEMVQEAKDGDPSKVVQETSASLLCLCKQCSIFGLSYFVCAHAG